MWTGSGERKVLYTRLWRFAYVFNSSNESINDTVRRGDSIGSLQTSFSPDTPIEDVPPPAYSEVYGRVDLGQDGLNTVASVSSV